MIADLVERVMNFRTRGRCDYIEFIAAVAGSGSQTVGNEFTENILALAGLLSTRLQMTCLDCLH